MTTWADAGCPFSPSGHALSGVDGRLALGIWSGIAVRPRIPALQRRSPGRPGRLADAPHRVREDRGVTLTRRALNAGSTALPNANDDVREPARCRL